MASAPAITGSDGRSTSLPDTSNAVDSKLAPTDNVMASAPVSPGAAMSPSISVSPDASSAFLPSGMPSSASGAIVSAAASQDGSDAGKGGGDLDSIAQTLAGIKVATPTPPPIDSQRPSSPARRVQENIALHAKQQAEEEGSSPAVDASSSSAGAVATAPQSAQTSHHLYIGNLSPKISEDYLRSIFGEYGEVANVKILIHHHPQYPPTPSLYGPPGMNPGGPGGGPGPVSPFGTSGIVAPQMVPGESNYGFVEMADFDEAQNAVKSLDGRAFFEMPLKVSWAKQQRAPAAAVTPTVATSSTGNPEDGNGAGYARSGSVDETAGSGAGNGSRAQASFGRGLYHVFVGDLSPEVNDAVLRNHFAEMYASLHEARVMWDMHSGKSRGYGFLAFRERSEADDAIRSRNGDRLGGRTIRLNWASSKGSGAGTNGAGSSPGVANLAQAQHSSTSASLSGVGAGNGAASRPSSAKIGWGSAARSRSSTVQQQVAMQVGLARGPMNSYNTPVYAFGQQPPGSTTAPRPSAVHAASSSSSIGGSASHQQPGSPSGAQAQIEGSEAFSYEDVLQQTPAYNTTVYLGNLPPQTSQEELRPLFQQLGIVIEIRMQADRGYGFVKLDTHENAAQAILQLQGADFGGRQLRCSWGKDRETSNSASGAPRPSRNSFSHPAGSPHPSAASLGMTPPALGMVSPRSITSNAALSARDSLTHALAVLLDVWSDAALWLHWRLLSRAHADAPPDGLCWSTPSWRRGDAAADGGDAGARRGASTRCISSAAGPAQRLGWWAAHGLRDAVCGTTEA